jgi:hypothetical protein
MILGVVLSVMNAYWLAYTSEMMSSFLNAVFCLFALIAVSRPLTRYAPGAALSRQELLVVYIMVVMTSTIDSQGCRVDAPLQPYLWPPTHHEMLIPAARALLLNRQTGLPDPRPRLIQ